MSTTITPTGYPIGTDVIEPERPGITDEQIRAIAEACAAGITAEVAGGLLHVLDADEQALIGLWHGQPRLPEDPARRRRGALPARRRRRADQP
jgi:hypothetical protein